jgi:hypothetical protein
MSTRIVGGSRWWLPILAFLAGIAVHALAGRRPQTLMAEPSTTVATPVAYDNGAPAARANADSDICNVQQD